MVSKGDLMKLTDKDHGVDSELPQHWLDKMSHEMLLQYNNVCMWYAWSYQNNSGGRPIHLGEEFIHVLQSTKIQLKWPRSEQMFEISVMDIVVSLLEKQDNLVISVKE